MPELEPERLQIRVDARGRLFPSCRREANGATDERTIRRPKSSCGTSRPTKTESGFLPCLRRGEPVPAAKVAELEAALGRLERGAARNGNDQSPHRPRPSPPGTRISGLAHRRLAGRFRRTRDPGDPDRARGRRAHPFGPGHSLLPACSRPRFGATELTASAAWPTPSGGGALGDGRLADASFQPADVEALCGIVREQVALGLRDLSSRRKNGARIWRHRRAPGRGDRHHGDQPADRLSLCRHDDHGRGRHDPRRPCRDPRRQQQQRLLVDAPFPDRATLGGIYATNTSGPRRFGAGRPRDQIIGVSFVTSEGVVVKGGGRVVKNVAGYDFPKLLTGSLGTLGIITQLTLKVRPIPERSAIAWVRFQNLQAVAEALDRLNVSETRPIAMELLERVGRARSLARNGLARRRGRSSRSVTKRARRRCAWQLDRLKSELKRCRLTIVEEEPDRPILGESDRVSGSGDRAAELCRQPASVVGRFVRRRARPVGLVGPGPRRQRDCPSPRPGRMDARAGGRRDREKPPELPWPTAAT